MKKNIKEVKKNLAQENVKKFFELLNNENLKDFHQSYVREILSISKSFNIKLSREEKLRFCKRCFNLWPEFCKIRIDSKNHVKEYICQSCGFTKRIKFVPKK